MKKVLVIGSTNVDITLRTNLFPKRGETLMALNMSKSLGGKGANQAIAVSNTGTPTSFLTALGNDINKEYCLDILKNHNIDVRYIEKNAPTGSAYIIVESSTSENQIIVNG